MVIIASDVIKSIQPESKKYSLESKLRMHLTVTDKQYVRGFKLFFQLASDTVNA